MRICIIGNALGVHVRRWAEAYRDEGHQVAVVSIRAADIEGVEVETLAWGPVNSTSRGWTLLSYLWMLVAVRRVVRRLAPDVLHAHFVTTSGVFARTAGGAPIVLTAYGSDVVPASPGKRRPLIRLLNRWALRGADRVTAASHYLADQVQRLAPDCAVTVVPFGVDTTQFHPPTEPAPPDRFVVGVVKSLEPRYGVSYVVEAMARVARQLPTASLAIAGGGGRESELRSLVVRRGIEASVHFHGRVQHRDVPALMRGFDVLVNPTVVPEAFGVVILEASASGLPVVSTRVGGVGEACREDETALLVPPRDAGALAIALLELAADPGRRTAMGRTGRTFVESTFPWQESVAGMVRVLEDARTSA